MLHILLSLYGQLPQTAAGVTARSNRSPKTNQC